MVPSPGKPWWVYVLQCRDGTLYTGIALDVAARLAQHQAGKGAKYTRGRGPVGLVYRESCGNRSTASRREAAIKRLSRREKLLLIHGHAAVDPVEAEGNGQHGPFQVGDAAPAIPKAAPGEDLPGVAPGLGDFGAQVAYGGDGVLEG